MSGCDDEARAECLRRFDRLESMLCAALEARERVGRLEAVARFCAWALTAVVAVCALIVSIVR